MAQKTYAGWGIKRWRNHIAWVLTSHQFTAGSKAAECYEKRRQLILAGDWDSFPDMEIKMNIQFYAFLHEKFGGANNPPREGK